MAATPTAARETSIAGASANINFMHFSFGADTGKGLQALHEIFCNCACCLLQMRQSIP
jgi:hypothetical protein